MCDRCDEEARSGNPEDPNVQKYGFTAGYFVTVKDGIKKYKITGPGVLCLCLGIKDSRDPFGPPGKVAVLIAFDDAHGSKEVLGDPDDFRVASPEEVSKRKAECAALWHQVEHEGMQTGDPVRFKRDVIVRDTGPMGCGTTTVRKGTYAILDFADDGEDMVEEKVTNRVKDTSRGPRKRKEKWLFGDKHIFAQDFYGPRSSVYIPDQEAEHKIPLSALERNPTECLEQKLVLPEGHMLRLKSVMRRVIDADVADV